MTTLELSVIDYVLSNILSFVAGVFVGLSVCACHKDLFMQRERSVEDFSRFNHVNRMTEPSVIMASAPKI